MRIRSIKPQFWANETLAELSHRTRLLFIGLWNLANRRGRLEDRPKRIRVEVFPYEVEPVDSNLAQLEAAGFLVRYEREGLNLIQINNFEKHQRITGKEAEAVLGAAHMTINKNAIPNDPEKPMVTSGVRIGTPAMTTGWPADWPRWVSVMSSSRLALRASS